MGLRRWHAEPMEPMRRVIVAVTGAPSSEQVIRRAARIAERSGAELVAVHVHPSATTGSTGTVLDGHRRILGDIGVDLHDVHAEDVVAALVGFARQQGADQLVLGTSRRSRIDELLHGSVLNDVLRAASDMDVHVVGQVDVASAPLDLPRRRQPSALPLRRRQIGWFVATAGVAGVSAVLAASRTTLGEGSEFLVLQAVVVVAAAVGGTGPAAVAALLAATSLNWWFLPPLYTWEIDDHENVLALVLFVLVGLLVGLLVTSLAKRTAAARQGQTRAEALARAAIAMAAAEDPLQELLVQLHRTLGLTGASIHQDGTREPLAVVGGEPSRDEASSVVQLGPGVTLHVAGTLRAGDGEVLDAFAAQLGALIERRRLREDAARADALDAADQLRTAILRAVSHDLRTPLASIKASVTSLRQHDMEWDDESEREFLATIEEEADRLDAVVADLLDASRLEAGAITPVTQLVALDDVVAASIASISGLRAAVDIDVSPSLPMVRADSGLLTRAVANIVANANEASPPNRPVRITADRVDGRVELRIIDHGPGVPESERDRIFAPFQRGDGGRRGGVGLGLAVARGVVTAMGGDLRLDDTPGGGLTMIVALPAADGGS